VPLASGFGSNANTGTSIFGGGANNTGSTMFGGGNTASSSSPFGGSGMWNGCASLSRPYFNYLALIAVAVSFATGTPTTLRFSALYRDNLHFRADSCFQVTRIKN
jgi:hypothetical protein